MAQAARGRRRRWAARRDRAIPTAGGTEIVTATAGFSGVPASTAAMPQVVYVRLPLGGGGNPHPFARSA
ncbi:hypothetical protein [Streptomyces sp. NPDC005859]|uniref:hypothetical protein n=1 Tax=Streptomyces sp. NPDC005859 TaxID=3157170 RepID=UPI0033E5F2B2